MAEKKGVTLKDTLPVGLLLFLAWLFMSKQTASAMAEEIPSATPENEFRKRAEEDIETTGVEYSSKEREEEIQTRIKAMREADNLLNEAIEVESTIVSTIGTTTQPSQPIGGSCKITYSNGDTIAISIPTCQYNIYTPIYIEKFTRERGILKRTRTIDIRKIIEPMSSWYDLFEPNNHNWLKGT